VRKLCFGSIFSILSLAKNVKNDAAVLSEISNYLHMNFKDWGDSVYTPAAVSDWKRGKRVVPEKVQKIAQSISSINPVSERIKNYISKNKTLIGNRFIKQINITLKNALFEDKDVDMDHVLLKDGKISYTRKYLLTQDCSTEDILTVLLIYTLAYVRNDCYKGIKESPLQSEILDTALSTEIVDLCYYSDDNRFNDVMQNKKLLEIGDCLCQLSRFKGGTPNKFIIDQIEEKTAKLEELLPDSFSIVKGSYDTLYSSIVDFYKNNDIVSYCGIMIGIYLSEVDASMETTVDLKSLPCNVLVKPEKLENLIDQINHLSIKNKQDQIANFLIDQYVNQESLNATIIIDENKIQDILSFLDFNCKTLKSAQELVEVLIKQNQAIANKEAQNVLTTFKNTLDNLKDTEYLSYMKYRIWPESVWNDLELFEEICMDNIEIITTNSKDRQEAIELAEKSISIGKILNTGRDMQIFSRVAYEFSIASDEEFELLKKQIDMEYEELEEDIEEDIDEV